MKKLLNLWLFGIAFALWVGGLGFSLRTSGGLTFAILLALALGTRFGPSLIEGTFRAELAEAVPNQWLRRYLILFGYFFYAFAGLLGSLFSWYAPSYAVP